MPGGWAGSRRRAELPPNWYTEIRPAILQRDGYQCRAVLADGRRCTERATDVDHIGNRHDHRPANLQALFTRVAAVVHHGGAGTTTTAALAGAPQVVVPHIYDQHYWARRVHELGIGTSLAAGAPTVESLTSALELALRSDVVTRARALAPQISQAGAEAAARRLRDIPR